MAKILVVGDLHLPFQNKAAVRKVLQAIKREKPSHVVQIGDLYDFYNFSRFSKKNLLTSRKELKAARKAAVDFWQQVGRFAPRAKRYQILGNHDVRATKRVADKVPELVEFVEDAFKPLFTFKGVETIYDTREELKIHGIIFIHGYRSGLGDHMRYNGTSTVCGHSHVGGVVFRQYRGRVIWELNAGYLANEKSEPLKYRPQATSNWTLGYGLITIESGRPAKPQFIPLK